MHELIATANRGASREAIDSAARELGRALAPALERLVERANGGDLNPAAVLRVPDGSTAGAIRVLPVEEIASVTNRLLGDRASHVVWARDGNGNALTVDDAGHVYFWDHDTDEELPFGCTIDRLFSEHFFERKRERSKSVGSPTAAALHQMLEDGMDDSSVESFLSTALSDATAPDLLKDVAGHGRRDIVRWILQRAAPSAEQLAAALERAARSGSVGVVEELLDAGADIDARDGRTDMTALMAAATTGQEGVIKFLLDRGADPRATTKRGRTAKQMARTSSRPELAALINLAMSR